MVNTLSVHSSNNKLQKLIKIKKHVGVTTTGIISACEEVETIAVNVSRMSNMESCVN